MKNAILLLSFVLLTSLVADAQCTPSVTIVPNAGSTLTIACPGGGLLDTFTATPTNGGTAPTYQWYLDGVPAGSGSVYIYSNFFQFGLDTISVVMTSNAPCASPDTAINYIVVGLVPPSVTVTQQIIPHCSDATVVYYISSVSADSLQFTSDGGNPPFAFLGIAHEGTLAHPALDTLTFTYNQQGLYQPFSYGYNTAGGCSATNDGDSVFISFGSNISQSLCMVSIDTNVDKPIVLWNKADKYATDSFYIYRVNTPTTTFTQFAAIGRDSLSEWEDTSAHPDQMSYRYAISILDTCGNVSSLSPYIQTVFLTYLGSGQFSWTPYVLEGDTIPQGTYALYRDSSGTGNWQLLVSLSDTSTTASDPSYASYPNARYMVVITLANACNPTRGVTSVFSNIISHITAGINSPDALTDLKVVPNPAHDNITVSCPGITGSATVSLSDMLGHTVYSADMNSGQLSIRTADMPAGVYFVTVSSGSERSVVKVLKW